MLPPSLSLFKTKVGGRNPTRLWSASTVSPGLPADPVQPGDLSAFNPHKAIEMLALAQQMIDQKREKDIQHRTNRKNESDKTLREWEVDDGDASNISMSSGVGGTGTPQSGLLQFSLETLPHSPSGNRVSDRDVQNAPSVVSPAPSVTSCSSSFEKLSNTIETDPAAGNDTNPWYLRRPNWSDVSRSVSDFYAIATEYAAASSERSY